MTCSVTYECHRILRFPIWNLIDIIKCKIQHKNIKVILCLHSSALLISKMITQQLFSSPKKMKQIKILFLLKGFESDPHCRRGVC